MVSVRSNKTLRQWRKKNIPHKMMCKQYLSINRVQHKVFEGKLQSEEINHIKKIQGINNPRQANQMRRNTLTPLTHIHRNHHYNYNNITGIDNHYSMISLNINGQDFYEKGTE